MSKLEKELIIVTGAGGDVGAAFLRKAVDTKANIVGIHRSSIDDKIPGVVYRDADLLYPEQVLYALDTVDFKAYNIITVIHPVGKFKWEERGTPAIDHDGDGIDDDVYASNVNTFTNIVKPVLYRARKNTLINIGCFASLSDKENVPFWHSYTASKNEVRARMRGLAAFDDRVATTMVNLPSVDTKNENETRPSADKTFWMPPQQVADDNLDLIRRKGRDFREVNRYVHSPEYYDGYYSNYPAVYARWKAGMRPKALEA